MDCQPTSCQLHDSDDLEEEDELLTELDIDSHRAGKESSTRLIRNEEVSPRWHLFALLAVVFVCYFNALDCGLVFDDISAIRDNRDVRPQTQWLELFKNDFWGTPIKKEQSHKSYRPLTVLSFRLNYLIHELNPFGYHLVNVFLHTIVCLLYYKSCNIFMPWNASFAASLLFAIHPIHTEAVTSIVGRAELLCSIFFILAFNCYIEAAKSRMRTEWTKLCSTVAFVIIATLCKEQGITVVAVCATYEIFVVQKLTITSILRTFHGILLPKTPHTLTSNIKGAFLRLAILSISAIFLLMMRLRLMGSQLPVFTKFDNPAAAASFPTKQLTFNYLLPLNSWLLLFPLNLCCDWTMGTISLVDSILDPRNLATIAFYLMITILIWKALTVRDGVTEHVIMLSLSLAVFPYIPASNMFFPVGFVIAERVLYIPSMGFCMLVGYGWHQISSNTSTHMNLLSSLNGSTALIKKLASLCFVFILISHSARTIIRNVDWKNEYSIFTAGLKVTKENAKLYNNVGHALESQAKYEEALEYFLKAVRVQPDDIGALMNVGRTYGHLNKFDLSESALRRAKDLLPKPRPGDVYHARIAPSHLNVFLNLANLISRDIDRLEEADILYQQVISMRADYTQAYINRGDILMKLNRTSEAKEVYEKALQFDSMNADIYYNLGVVLLEQGKATQSLVYFNKALELEPEHEQALLNSAIVIQESGNGHLRDEAKARLHKLIAKGKANERVYFNLGMLAMDINDTKEGERWFREAIKIKPNFRSALFNLALLLSELNRSLEAIPFLEQLLLHHGGHVKGLLLLGDIYMNVVKHLDAAERCYVMILKADPLHIRTHHNLCVVHVERGNLLEAESCFEEVVKLAPLEDYITRHLSIVRQRITSKSKDKEIPV